MRPASNLLALALLAACEREDPVRPMWEATSTSASEASTTWEPSPLPPCADGLVDAAGVCLRTLTVKLPYAHEFIRHADFDGDGTGDLFAINTFFHLFAAIFFVGSLDAGGLDAIVALPFENYDSFRSVVLDFDGDGLMDLASPTLLWYFSGDVETYRTELVAWRNLGGYEFADGDHAPWNSLSTLAAGDVDSDGRTDLFVINNLHESHVWAYVAEKGGLELVSKLDLAHLDLGYDPLVVAADHDGDTHADFVLMDDSGRAWWIVGGPGHQLTLLDPQAQDVVLTPGSQTLYARDINADGLVDLAAARVEYVGKQPLCTISLALGQAGGGFAALTQFDAEHPVTWAGFEFSTPEENVTHLGFFDLDGSGQLALVYAHRERPELVIHPHIAETRGEAQTIVPLDFPANSLFVDDFEGDGEDAIYVTISDITMVEPSVQHPDGRISEHHLVRFSPDP